VEKQGYTDEHTLFGEIRHRIIEHSAETVFDAHSRRRTRQHTHPESESDRVTSFSKAADPFLADTAGDSEEAVHGNMVRTAFPRKRALDVEQVQSLEVYKRRFDRRRKFFSAKREESPSSKSDLALRDAFDRAGGSRYADLDRTGVQARQ
jgi:hypothetical protein